jgi:hypothetical protein
MVRQTVKGNRKQETNPIYLICMVMRLYGTTDIYIDNIPHVYTVDNTPDIYRQYPTNICLYIIVILFQD